MTRIRVIQCYRFICFAGHGVAQRNTTRSSQRADSRGKYIMCALEEHAARTEGY